MPTSAEIDRAQRRRVKLVELLRDRRLAGRPMPSISELCAELDVSSMTVRRDLSVLVELGVVETLGVARGIVLHLEKLAALGVPSDCGEPVAP